MTPYEREVACRREAYILAKKSPWHLWSAQALRQGYIPPLIPGVVPPDIPRLLPVGWNHDDAETSCSLGKLRMEKQAESRWNNFARQAMGYVFSLIILASISLIAYAIMYGGDFQVAMVNHLGH